ncbi:MAG: fibronectin type III domain-containing protein [Pseudomonadota bacterium]|nr:fibronectin type III domain-containing protein [Pseudomonadota bacterium]
MGSSYSFQPTASVSGTGVTFSIQGQASWMSFNATTGAVSGTPAAVDEGQTAGITITVSDGANSASIGPFTVSVQPPAVAAPGSAALSWSAPASNEDGSPITGLAGYHVYYGTDPSNFGSTVDVVGAASTAYTVTNLAAGTYYFAVAAYNSDGVESPMSNIGNKTI